MEDTATKQAKQELEDWFVTQLQRGQAVWLHAVYRAVLPEAIYSKVAAGNLALGTEYCKANGYAVKGYLGMTEILKNGLTVARFIPKLVGDKEDAHLEFDASVLGNPIDVLALMKNTALDRN